MDFFNKLSKKTNEVYKGAKEKTVKMMMMIQMIQMMMIQKKKY